MKKKRLIGIENGTFMSMFDDITSFTAVLHNDHLLLHMCTIRKEFVYRWITSSSYFCCGMWAQPYNNKQTWHVVNKRCQFFFTNDKKVRITEWTNKCIQFDSRTALHLPVFLVAQLSHTCDIYVWHSMSIRRQLWMIAVRFFL